jgi:quinol monooxygenase YgiN
MKLERNLLFVIAGIMLIFTNACNSEEKIKINAAVPVITVHPEGAEYYVDALATDLTVTASTSDGGTLSYQWYSNTINNNKTGTQINGANSAQYSPPTDESTMTYYYVIVTNSIPDNGDGGNKTATAESKTAGIEVNEKIEAEVPFINSHPQGAIYTLDAQAVNLTVSASTRDEGTLSYQWYSNTNNNTTGTLITGAKEKDYKPATSELGITYYYVIITNTISDNGDGGKKVETKVSASAKIEVNNKTNAEVPNITVHPKGGIHSAGQPLEDLTVTVSPLSDGGTLSYQWYSNAINSTENGTLISGETDKKYRPPNNPAGEMYYYVVVINTISDNGDGGNKTASIISKIAEIALN